MATLRLTLLLLAILAATCAAQKPAPAPTPSPVNLTGILSKAGQFNTFIRLLTTTQVADQVNSQVNHSSEGMTVFAPTDNAFQNLKPGAINSLTTQEQVQLVLYHVLPKYFSIDSFETASNPVRTQATGNDGKAFDLTVTYLGVNRVNVSTGLVTTQVNSALSDKFPLAVYQVDKVLLPNELFGPKPPKSSPSSPPPEQTKTDGDKPAKTPTLAAADKAKSGAYGVRSMGLGFVATVVGLVSVVISF
ncbi:hypothetical protein RND81_14G028000 [Saponaria officinalis]|uniref:FAS1 domain-containing protein n=1 Tax=Saponaria officinalis TaxID=3572 RepID=A0AAW1GKA5_SAPOF